MIKSAYIHIPFCNNICFYCAFCKMLKNDAFVDKYLNSLETEIKKNYKGDILDTLYIGGGTPTSLNEKELTKLFSILKTFKLNEEYEYTFEANILDINEKLLSILKSNRVNRLSIGIESFDENNQKLLNELRKLYDIIILDCPPVIGLSDTMIMTKFSDANIIVVSNKKTKIESLDRAKKIFAQANAKITGVVINKASVKGSSYYSYYSDEYYRDTDSKKKRKR